MLPENAQQAHKLGMLERHHLENLPLASFKQIFAHACENFPEMHTKYLPLEDALLVTLCASEPQYEVECVPVPLFRNPTSFPNLE